MKKSIVTAILLSTELAVGATVGNGPASQHEEFKYPRKILVDTVKAHDLDLAQLQQDSKSGLSVAILPNTDVAEKLHELSHLTGACAGYEDLGSGIQTHLVQEFDFTSIHQMLDKEVSRFLVPNILVNSEPNEKIQRAILEVEQDSLKEWVGWLSSYPTRSFRAQNPNEHVYALKQKLEKYVGQSDLKAEVSLVSHRGLGQKTVKVRVEGSERPDEIVVLGGHLDSTTQSFFSRQAPGADDNASGSANLIQALRILLAQQLPPQRTVEFFWYAGEEGGLLGSKEIAAEYKAQNKNVIGVLQLDMTLFPGSGVFTLGSMTDFTSSWLRQLLIELNDMYIGANIVESKCGYGCSDHASWYRNGFPTLMPFEATMQGINSKIHSKNDVVDGRLDFSHSMVFSKIAVAFSMHLANSNLKHP